MDVVIAAAVADYKLAAQKNKKWRYTFDWTREDKDILASLGKIKKNQF
jgi:phosphopantothenoylcysteine synthetase/decarboxylase